MGRPRDVVAAGVFAALGAGICVRAGGLGIGTAVDPQPGSFPLAAGVLLIVLPLILGLLGLRRGGGPDDPMQENVVRAVILVAGLLVHAAFLEWVGYPLMTGLVVLLVLRVLYTEWLPGIVVSGLLSLGSYFLFVKLGVPLPVGTLFGG